MSAHKTRVLYQRGWFEWRPECSCGWVGSYWKSEARAALEAEGHLKGPPFSCGTWPFPGDNGIDTEAHNAAFHVTRGCCVEARTD